MTCKDCIHNEVCYRRDGGKGVPDNYAEECGDCLTEKDLQRPQGEWKLDMLGAYCTICHYYPDYTSNFCPNCGARMGGKEE